MDLVGRIIKRGYLHVSLLQLSVLIFRTRNSGVGVGGGGMAGDLPYLLGGGTGIPILIRSIRDLSR